MYNLLGIKSFNSLNIELTFNKINKYVSQE